MSTSTGSQWFHGIEHLTVDGSGNVSWRGVEVEHFDHAAFGVPGWQEKERADAAELGRRCRALEQRGEDVIGAIVTGHWPTTLTREQLADLMRHFAPHGKNGLADQIWSALRGAGQNRLAEALTTATNAMRAAQYEVSQQMRNVETTADHVALHDEHGEILRWSRQQWIDEPALVLEIAKACLRAGRGEDLRGPLEGKDAGPQGGPSDAP